MEPVFVTLQMLREAKETEITFRTNHTLLAPHRPFVLPCAAVI